MVVSNFCQTIYDAAVKKSKPSFLTEEKLISAVDVFNIKGIVDGCKDTSNKNKAVACAKSVLNTASTFDPTGALSIAAAFMHPACPSIKTNAEVDALAELQILGLKSKEEKLAHDLINNRTLTNNLTDCIVFYSDYNYQGESHIVCDQQKDPRVTHGYKIKSYFASETTSGFLYEGCTEEASKFKLEFGPAGVSNVTALVPEEIRGNFPCKVHFL